MNEQGVVLLLGALSKYPAQIMAAPDDLAVGMWRESLDDEIPLEWAMQWVARYFSRSDVTPIGPGEINAAWRAVTPGRLTPRIEAGTEPPVWWRQAREAGRLPGAP